MSIEKRDDTGFEPEARLEQLAEEIAEGLIRLDEKWRATVAQAIEVGEKLNEAKALVGVYGQWIPWLREQFPGSVRTAQEYMRLAREKRSVAHLPSVREAVAALTQPKAKALPEARGDFSAEWQAMSNGARKATMKAARVLVDQLLAESKARGEEYVDVPRWTLDPLKYAIKSAIDLHEAARDGNVRARLQLEEFYRKQGKRLVYSR